MKRIKYPVLVLSAILMCLCDVTAQWQPVEGYNSNYTLSGLWFCDADTGIAVGKDWTDNTSLILRTNDAGQTWNPVSHPKINNGNLSYLYDLSFSDPMHGWTVGQLGWVLNTKDGGISWTKMTFPISVPILTIFSLDTNHVWAGIPGPVYYHSPDGGNTWDPQTTELETFPWDIFFFNADTGIAVGGWCSTCDWDGHQVEDAGYILRTTNGGTDWTLIDYDTIVKGYNKIFFVNDTIGYISGDGGTILKTENGGLNWTKQTSGTTQELYGIYFINPDTGYVVGGKSSSGYSGIILYTEDGGSTWTQQSLPSTRGLYDVYFIDDNTGWTVGEWGVINYTTNGGKAPGKIEYNMEPLTRIHPNPSDGFLTVEINNKSQGGLVIEILTVTGKVIYEKRYYNTCADFTEQLNLSGYPEGLYLLKVKQAQAVYVGKIVLK